MKMLASLLVIFAFSACTRDIDFPDNPPTSNQNIPCDSMVISVNEIAPGGSADEPADWVEIYNPQTTSVSISAGEWSVSDDPTEPGKYIMPAITIPSKSFISILCDDINAFTGGVIHTNFKLSSSSGDFFGIYRKVSGQWKMMDGFTFNPQAGPNSISRRPDGCGKWNYNTQATYQKSNV